jgi:hypothetical protein
LLLGASGFFLFLLFAFWIWALFDCITTDAAACRNLPKLVWLLLVILLFDIGAIAWVLLGRPPRARSRFGRSDQPASYASSAAEEPRREAESSAITDRRSAELDRRLEAWEAEQAKKRASESEGSDRGDLP